MSFFKKEAQPRVCPKTGKIINPVHNKKWAWWLFPFTGLAALIWFLIRVIPKPSRAAYPCQRVAFPIASGFIIWALGLAGSAVAYRKAKHAFARARYVVAAIAIIASVGFIWMAMSSTNEKPASAHEPIVHNSPIGVGKGVHPGRVAWIHDANATNWNGGHPPYWWDNTCINQQVVNQMLSKSLRALTGRGDDASAWDAIFRNYNQQHGRGNVGYTAGEKIAIKMNWVLMVGNINGTKNNYLDDIDNSPQLAIALLNQLTGSAGVSPGNISIGDPQNCMADYWYNIVGPNCPGVVYLTRNGYPLSGRTTVAADANAPFYWSDPCAAHWSGVTNTDHIPTHFSQATYLINFPILKSHNSAGITLSGKNFYGSLMRAPNATGYYNMHNTRPGNADSSPFSTPGMGYYRDNVDLLGHPKLGGKTLLVLIDGLYGGRSWDSEPIKWNMAPFNNDWPSSIFLSQDPIAADSVAFDFMDNEWNAAAGTINGYPQYSGTDDYLHEAALVPNPPSGTHYDPNHDGGLTQSLGVHEHWDSATSKQYSRNLGTGDGIELVNAAPGWPDLNGDRFIDFRDFAILANAWGSHPGDSNWDPNCDISAPADNVIDEKDLAVLCDNWLEDFTSDYVMPGATLQELYSISGSAFEGATWDPNSHKLFFTKRTSPYQILRYESPGTVTVWMNPSNQTNGMIISNDGRLLCCDESTLQITSRFIGINGLGDTQILADSSDGFTKMPNDLCQLTNGNIYFTTPAWDGSGPSAQGVWLIEPNSTVRCVNNTLNQPNGIITSLDETKLYVSEGSSTAANQRWSVFTINSDGTLGSPTQFFKPSNPPNTTNVPDGMTIDELGNLYFCGLGGVWIVSPAGQQLGFISVANPYNIAFGGNDGRTLYIVTGNGKLYSLAMCVRGGE
jgi:sugar lactone lactonase YvrE